MIDMYLHYGVHLCGQYPDKETAIRDAAGTLTDLLNAENWSPEMASRIRAIRDLILSGVDQISINGIEVFALQE